MLTYTINKTKTIAFKDMKIGDLFEFVPDGYTAHHGISGQCQKVSETTFKYWVYNEQGQLTAIEFDRYSANSDCWLYQTQPKEQPESIEQKFTTAEVFVKNNPNQLVKVCEGLYIVNNGKHTLVYNELNNGMFQCDYMNGNIRQKSITAKLNTTNAIAL